MTNVHWRVVTWPIRCWLNLPGIQTFQFFRRFDRAVREGNVADMIDDVGIFNILKAAVGEANVIDRRRGKGSDVDHARSLSAVYVFQTDAASGGREISMCTFFV